MFRRRAQLHRMLLLTRLVWMSESGFVAVCWSDFLVAVGAKARVWYKHCIEPWGCGTSQYVQHALFIKSPHDMMADLQYRAKVVSWLLQQSLLWQNIPSTKLSDIISWILPTSIYIYNYIYRYGDHCTLEKTLKNMLKHHPTIPISQRPVMAGPPKWTDTI